MVNSAHSFLLKLSLKLLSPQDSVENDVSDPEPVSTDSDEEEMKSRGYLDIGSN